MAVAFSGCYVESVPTGAEEEVSLFASYEAARESVTIDDSIPVNVVVYSSVPFKNVELQSKDIKAKGGTMRLLPGRGLQQQRVRRQDGVFYAVVYRQYMVSSRETGTITLPELKFSAELIIYDETEERYSPFDFFGFSRQTPRKSHIINQKCRSKSLKLEVLPKPKRSTQEIIKSGARVI